MIFLTARDLRKILGSKGKIKILEFNKIPKEIDVNKIKPLIKKSFLKDNESYFVFDGKSLYKFGFFRDGLYYKLVPTSDAPALEISGVKMHRIVNTSPWKDAKEKVLSLNPKGGILLDCCTGLGYTAIWASRYCDKIITIELDENVLEIARINPWSKELFENPKIELIFGDVKEKIKEFEDESFDYFIHDPPQPTFDEFLYSRPFYKELYRILKPGGRGYIYGTRRKRYREYVKKRLLDVGFTVKGLEKLDGFLVEKV